MRKLSLILALSILSTSNSIAQNWVDVSTPLITDEGITPDYPGGCSGVVADRVNGGVLIDINGFGIWKSANGVDGWVRIDNSTISGRGETGSSLQIDQNNPARLVVFSLDGTAGYTTDGTTWHAFTSMGRGWDFGSVDWTTQNPQVMIATKHEDGGKVYKTTNAGQSWELMNITVNAQSNSDKSMVGVLNATTFVYCSGNGIKRSTDGGATWNSVSGISSSTNARSKVPVFFNGAYYLGTAMGLIKSTDVGATWQAQGSSRDIWQGPYFGSDEATMVVADKTRLYKTTNGGTTWTLVATAPQTTKPTQYDAQWAGSFTWDPVGNAVFASEMWNSVVRRALANTATIQQHNHSASQASALMQKRVLVVNGIAEVARNTGSGIRVFSTSRDRAHAQVFSIRGELVAGNRRIDN